MFKLTKRKCVIELKEVSQYGDQNTQQYSKHDSLL